MKPTIKIEYCPKCGWLLRAAYMASELLTTFSDELNGVLLQPTETSGKFRISISQLVIHDRKTDGGFPEITTLKRAIRDIIAPDKSLGHTDKNKNG